MISSFWVALRAEIYVGLRSHASRLVVVLPALIACAQLVLTSMLAASREASETMFGGMSVGQVEGADAWGTLVDAYATGLTLIGLLLTGYAAWSLANDKDSGVLRHLLIRHASRRTMLMVKLTHAHLLGIASILALLLSCTLCAWLIWDFGPVVEDGYELIGTAEILSELRLGLLLAIIPLPAAIAMGLLVSVLAGNSTQALVAALGITLALDILKGIIGAASDYIYASYLVSLLDSSYLRDVSRLVRGFSDVMINPTTLQMNQWVPWPQAIFLLLLAWYAINRKPV
ncbi:ABC transporter permease subunit [Pseudohongiella sp. SYSU M77423]|uniref:ABC transporter permease subunit n=1 Tax=Pseudohongiella sp. SYSU M77423 TaxID=3042312 RepID=UPI0024808280|nr:ABC transporter permease subunit [Pseudohongiella sp. SYSU M77423]MDH7942253.1 ABC transporter permease subunit [Pseudohongiella sp. SYSU M77423]